MPNVSYPEDRTGISQANLIPREPHTLTEINAATYRTIIPDFAPFYLDNFEVIWEDGEGVEHVMQRDIDFVLTIPYLSASQVVQKMLYGGIAMNTIKEQGMLYFRYQTLGGVSIASAAAVREKLYEMLENPRTTSWDILANLPEQFPPSDHDHPFDDLTGSDQVVQAINAIPAALAAGPDPENSFIKHLLITKGNPHGTDKEDIGLGDVENLPLATDDEVIAKSRVDKYVTLRQVLLLLRSNGVNL